MNKRLQTIHLCLGTALITAKFCTTIGTTLETVLPGLGNVVGAIVGFGIGLGVGVLLDIDIGGKKVIDHIRDGVYNFFD